VSTDRFDRHEYLHGTLDREDLDADPFAQFRKWYEDARTAGHLDPSAMSLATVSATGAPHARMVLLKSLDERGFIFCTHRTSVKGQDIAQNPNVAMVFYWPKIERQVRIEGVAQFLSAEENAEFYLSRPRGAQIAASLGHQSEPVADHETLERLYEEAVKRFEGKDVTPLETWGAYAVTPSAIEFWQGGENRLHDRFRYTCQKDGWQIDRLMP